MNVLIVDRPGAFRDALVSAVRARGAAVSASDGALEALGRLRELAPRLVVVSDACGPPDVASTARLVRRQLGDVVVYHLHDPTAGASAPETRSLSRLDHVDALARELLDDGSPAARADVVVTPAIDAPEEEAIEELIELASEHPPPAAVKPAPPTPPAPPVPAPDAPPAPPIVALPPAPAPIALAPHAPAMMPIAVPPAAPAPAAAPIAALPPAPAPIAAPSPAPVPAPLAGPPPTPVGTAALPGERAPAPAPEAAPTQNDAHSDPDAALLAEVEPLVHQGRWQELIDLVGKREPDPQRLSPRAALLFAVALKEAPAPASGARPTVDPDLLGVRAVAALLQLDGQSLTALMIAKRVLRRRPLEWQRTPPRRVSIVITLIALALGAAAGLAFKSYLIPLWYR